MSLVLAKHYNLLAQLGFQLATPTRRLRALTPLSYSAISTYATCPRQFEALYVTKVCRREDTAATKHGTRVHEAAEAYLRTGDRSAPEPWPGAWLELDSIRPLAPTVEVGGAVRFVCGGVEGVAYQNPAAALRGRMDVVVTDGDKAVVVDWKTGSGKKRDHTLQGLVYQVLAQGALGVSQVEVVFHHVDRGVEQVVYPEPDAVPLVAHMVAVMEGVEAFYPRQSGLCRDWCPVPPKDCSFRNGR